ncbi:unnamed protein product [Urochloa humidicola]
MWGHSREAGRSASTVQRRLLHGRPSPSATPQHGCRRSRHGCDLTCRVHLLCNCSRDAPRVFVVMSVHNAVKYATTLSMLLSNCPVGVLSAAVHPQGQQQRSESAATHDASLQLMHRLIRGCPAPR